MRTSLIFTMASAIFLTSLLIYIHTHVCYGQQNSLFNHENFKKQHSTTGLQTLSNKPNIFFSNNLTDGAGGKASIPQFQLINTQNQINQRERPCESPITMKQAIMSPQITTSPQQPQKAANSQPPYVQRRACNADVPPSGFSSNIEQPALPSLNNQPIRFTPAQQTVSLQPPQLQSLQQQEFMTQRPLVIPSTSSPLQFPNNIQTVPGTIQVYMTPGNIPANVYETPQNIFGFLPASLNSVPSGPTNFYQTDPSVLVGLNQNPPLLQERYLSPPYKVAPRYNVNTVSSNDFETSQSASLKTLLPIILNLLKEKSANNNCCRSCDCECKKRANEDSACKQNKYRLNDDGPELELLSEEINTVRNVRERKKINRVQNIIDDSEEACYESFDGSTEED